MQSLMRKDIDSWLSAIARAAENGGKDSVCSAFLKVVQASVEPKR